VDGLADSAATGKNRRLALSLHATLLSITIESRLARLRKMFDFPKQAELNRLLPKSKVYELLETYLSKVKMIYIDPPYNKDADVIYKDTFAEDSETYFRRSNQKDDQGNRMAASTEANGRRHSDWLSLMYSRLRLAKNLLREDGIIFISIDSNEEANLRKICDETFGEDNFIGTIIWKNVTDNNPTNVATEHESVQVFARSKDRLEKVWKSSLSDVKNVLIEVGERLNREHGTPDALQGAYTRWFRENKTFLGPLDRYKYIDQGGVYTGSQAIMSLNAKDSRLASRPSLVSRNGPLRPRRPHSGARQRPLRRPGERRDPRNAHCPRLHRPLRPFPRPRTPQSLRSPLQP